MPEVGGTRLRTDRGSAIAELQLVLFVVIAVVVLCSLAAWLILHLGVEAVQALLAVVMMTMTWHLLRRRPGSSIADEFKYW
jgi:hypothetical protein